MCQPALREVAGAAPATHGRDHRGGPPPGRGSCSATTSTPMARWTVHSRRTCPTWHGGPNGRTRARIAETLMQAHQAGRIQATIGRGSDFFGPYAHLSTVGDRVFAQAVAGKPAQLLGNPDVPHTVTDIEDFARALVTLGERDEAIGEVWHVPSPETVTHAVGRCRRRDGRVVPGSSQDLTGRRSRKPRETPIRS